MRLAILLCIPLALAASDASAGIDLTWNGCSADAGTSTLDLTCSDGGIQSWLVGSFRVPAAVDSFYGLDVVIDVYSESGDLPDFWNFSSSGGCNVSGITRQLARPPGCTTTANVWGTNGMDGNGTYSYMTPVAGNLKRARLTAYLTRPSTTIDLAADTDYFGFSFLITTANASEAGGSCTGCPNPIAMLWNSATLLSDAVVNQGTVITDPGTSGLCVRINGANQTSCDAVPVKRSTWGSIKALYR